METVYCIHTVYQLLHLWDVLQKLVCAVYWILFYVAIRCFPVLFCNFRIQTNAGGWQSEKDWTQEFSSWRAQDLPSNLLNKHIVLFLAFWSFSHVFHREYSSAWLTAEATFTVNRVDVGGLCVCVSASVSVCAGLLLPTQDHSNVTLQHQSFQMRRQPCHLSSISVK